MMWDVPWARRSLSWHLQAAVTVVVCVGVAAGYFWFQQSRSLESRERELQSARAELQSLRDARPPEGSKLADLLAEWRVADDVVRDVGRHAQSLNLQVKSLTVQQVPSTTAELARVNFALSAAGDYPSLKSLLAELLGRFPTLAVQSLSLRRATGVGNPVEMQASLSLWVKD